MNRRSALGLIGGGTAALAVAACAPAAAPTAPAQPAAAEKPKPGGTLRYGSASDLNRLDPHFRIGDLYYGVYDRLTQYDVSNKPQPMLAETWEVAADYRQVKFNLRKGVMFHSGKEMDSAAVKFNSERARDLPNTQLDEAKWWTSIETPDKYTVIFKSDKPRPLAFDFFEYLNIADPATAADPKQAVGTGPFKFVEWKQGVSLTLVKNPNYWQSGKPYLDGAVMTVVVDPQALTARLEADGLDLASPSSSDYVRLRDNPKYTAWRNENTGGAALVGPQCQEPPWNDKKVRQAFAYAIDRKRWETINKSTVTAAALPWGKSSPAYDEKKGALYGYDPERAKSLLKEAGVTGTTNGEILITAGNSEYADFAQVYQADMAKLGFTMNIRALESAAYLDIVNNWKNKGIHIGGASFAHMDPGTVLTKSRELSPSGNSMAFAPPVNAYGVSLVDKATTEADPTKRKQIYSDINDMLIDETYAQIMSPTNSRLLTTARLKGPVPTLHGGWRWWEAYFAS